jgi:hypothetical protein
MYRDLVSSSNIVSAGYDEENQTLEIEFRDGSVYQYYNIGKAVYDQFITSPSKGQFLAYQIKNVFPYSRV